MDQTSSAPVTPPVSLHPVVAKIRRIESELGSFLIGRGPEIRGALLALAARQHAFYLGGPGSGKSYLVSEVCRRIRGDGGTFLIEFNAFILREELFGPISLREMRDNDSLARKYEGFLPSATVAQLDELWKAPPALLNTLLRILNEREFRNDTTIVRSPLISAFATSNELPPTDRSLDALYDRILLRYDVASLRSIDDRRRASTMRLAKRAFEAEVVTIADDLTRVRARRLAEAELSLMEKVSAETTESEAALRQAAGRELQERQAASDLAGEALEAHKAALKEEARAALLAAVAAERTRRTLELERKVAAMRARSAAEGLPAAMHHPDVFLIDELGEWFSDEAKLRGMADESAMPELEGDLDRPDVRELLKRVAKWAVRKGYVADYRTFLDRRDLDTLHGLILGVTFPAETEAAFYRILDDLPSARSVRRETDLRLIVAAQAVLENRNTVAIEDLEVMTHALWDRREDIPTVRAAVAKETVELERELDALRATVAQWSHELENDIAVDYETLSARRAQRETELRRFARVAEAHPENETVKAEVARAQQLNHDYEVATLGRAMTGDDDPFG